MDVMDNTSQQPAKQCFSSIQSRKFWGASLLSNACRLCPSMDLVVLGMPEAQQQQQSSTLTTTNTTTVLPAATSLWIHRTVSWQKLATLTYDKDTEMGATHVCWSPDGRLLAVALAQSKVILYPVESLSNQGSANGGASGGAGGGFAFGSTGGSDALSHHTLDLSLLSSRIVGLTWAHVGRPHPTAWKLSQDQVEDQVSWRYVRRRLFVLI
jgi:uncharacterized membrane protein YgcG